ncbi:MAG: hypothetical protein RBR74_08615 [Ignavibacteriaceae bacterium]|jgi:hypothetical protein|nr:hypothetical protein [Ignavibacteriaceae bacterium]
MNKNTKTILIILLSFAALACSKENYITSESVIEANTKYMNEENFDGVMNTIHKDSPDYPATETMIEKIFEVYDLNYNTISMKVIEETDTEAKVQFEQITTKLSGPEFRDNKISGIHTLKKDGDSWKIYSTQVNDIEYID